MGHQWQLTVYDNTEVTSGVPNGDASAEHQDVVAVDPVHKLTRAYASLMISANCTWPKIVNYSTIALTPSVVDLSQIPRTSLKQLSVTYCP